MTRFDLLTGRFAAAKKCRFYYFPKALFRSLKVLTGLSLRKVVTLTNHRDVSLFFDKIKNGDESIYGPVIVRAFLNANDTSSINLQTL